MRVFLKSPVRENRTPGSVRGAARKGRPYRDKWSEEREARRGRFRSRMRLIFVPFALRAFDFLRGFVIQALCCPVSGLLGICAKSKFDLG